MSQQSVNRKAKVNVYIYHFFILTVTLSHWTHLSSMADNEAVHRLVPRWLLKFATKCKVRFSDPFTFSQLSHFLT